MKVMGFAWAEGHEDEGHGVAWDAPTTLLLVVTYMSHGKCANSIRKCSSLGRSSTRCRSACIILLWPK